MYEVQIRVNKLTNPRQHGDTLCTAAGRVPGYARWLSWSKQILRHWAPGSMPVSATRHN